MKKVNNLNKKKFLKIAMIVIFPLITNGQWSIIGGATLNRSIGKNDYNAYNIINTGEKPLSVEVSKYQFSPNVCFGFRKETLFNDKMGYNWEMIYHRRSLNPTETDAKTFSHKLIAVPVLLVYNLNNAIAVEIGPQADLLLMKEIGYLRRVNISATTGLIFKPKDRFGYGIRLNNSIYNTIGQYSKQYSLKHTIATAYLTYRIGKK